MNARDLEVLNRRNRMSPEEVAADIVLETFGPIATGILFPNITPPKVQRDIEAEDDRR